MFMQLFYETDLTDLRTICHTGIKCISYVNI